jgi:hypothetical protein
MSVGGAIGCVAWSGGGVVVDVVVLVVDVVVEVVVVDVDVDVVVVLVEVVGGSVVVDVLVVVVVVVDGGAIVVVAAWAVPSSSVPAHDVSVSVAATSAARATEARRAGVSKEPPFPRANIGSIMSSPHRRVPAIA